MDDCLLLSIANKALVVATYTPRSQDSSHHDAVMMTKPQEMDYLRKCVNFPIHTPPKGGSGGWYELARRLAELVEKSPSLDAVHIIESSPVPKI